MTEKIITLEEKLRFITNEITKFINTLERSPEVSITSGREDMKLYSYIYSICSVAPGEYSVVCQQIYDLYRQSIEGYLTITVLPSLLSMHDEFLLVELVKRWKNHKVLVKWMSKIFSYIDRYYIPNNYLPSLETVGYNCFRNVVYQDINTKARDIAISVIELQRDGIVTQIDWAISKNFVDYLVDIGGWDYYEKHYENAILDRTASYYFQKALGWIGKDYYRSERYTEKAKECLRREEEYVSHYLHDLSREKLLNTVRQQLISVYEQNNNARVEDLSGSLASFGI